MMIFTARRVARRRPSKVSMPELGEVEIVRLNLERWWVGRAADEVVFFDPALVTRGTVAQVEEALGTRCLRALRRGKYLYVELEGRVHLIFHFRMTGKITLEAEESCRFARLSWRIDDRWLVFKDARRLGQIEYLGPGELEEYAPLLKMGPEPHDLSGEELKERVGKRVLKNALMDQSVIASVGNIAVSEVFFRERIAPDARADVLDDAGWNSLIASIVQFFDEVVASHASDEIEYVNQGGENPFDVYGREGEPCPRCGDAIKRMKVGGRSSYYCGSC